MTKSWLLPWGRSQSDPFTNKRRRSRLWPSERGRCCRNQSACIYYDDPGK